MKPLTSISAILFPVLLLSGCINKDNVVPETPEQIKIAIERILQKQEAIYDGKHTEEALALLAATCEDSLIFIGGDDGGLMVSSKSYVHDLGDGYTQKPHHRYVRIFNSNTVIVTSIQQAFKLFGKDTLFLNMRTTKIFVKNATDWKMAYTTYAPLPVQYFKRGNINPLNFSGYEGLYDAGSGLIDTVTIDDGKLYSAITGSIKDELIPLNDSTFIGEGYFGKAIFSRDAAKKVTHYSFEWPDGQRIAFLKIK